MDEKIKGPELIESALNEFWDKHPEWYGLYMHLLGHRFDQIAKGDLDQDEYIKEWKDKDLSEGVETVR